ncbi:MAG: hypothetical protein EKK29_00855 [Hyphomicrobiales bacterium]|jgi:hypothetical protein|nr:MAG: hypothetical protein EKK29_00855 [Hyphomicrobiales bacterium]
MITEEAKIRVSELLHNARSRLSGLKHMQLSPLSGIVLAALATMTSATALFALYAMLGPMGSDSEASAPDWTPPTLAAVELDPPKPASADVESLSRPIFSKNRKPTAKSAAAPTDMTAVSDAPSGLSVTAIIRHKTTAQAFLISTDTPAGAWRQVGDLVDSWTVTSINPKEVVLQSGGQFSKLKLYAEPPPAEPMDPLAAGNAPAK